MFRLKREIVYPLFFAVVLIETAVIIYQNSENIWFSTYSGPLSFVHKETEVADVDDNFLYNFDWEGVLQESPSMTKSSSPYWWLDSGGSLIMSGGVGSTLQGRSPELSFWRNSYARSSYVDTDGGYYPQNLFRLVTRKRWQNLREEAYFFIENDNTTVSPNRNASNGILLMSRYQNGDNLYYAGLRVDGAAVIKKKINGEYFTLAYKKILPGNDYDADKKESLLPKKEWIGLRSDVINGSDGSVTIKLYTDIGKKSEWKEVLSVRDDSRSFGGGAIWKDGYAGIRTDFMDVKFDNFRLSKLE